MNFFATITIFAHNSRCYTYSAPSPRIQWVKATTVFENEFVSVRLFVVPPYQTIPLHDHPGMIVYSRLYRGDVHAFSMSWCSEDGASKQVADGIWPPADISAGNHLCPLVKFRNVISLCALFSPQ